MPLIDYLTAQPTPSLKGFLAPQSPFDAAIAQAKQKYPRIANIPFALTTGKGPGMSETYEPQDETNPHPGTWTVQLRHPSVVNDKSAWPDYVALESLHPLYAQDKGYQQITDQFVKSMTHQQDAVSRQQFARERQTFGGGRAEGQYANNEAAYQAWLRKVQAHEYIRGMIFPKASPGWLGPKGEGGYTPQQLAIGKRIQQYLMSK